jgi:hypothetical protein
MLSPECLQEVRTAWLPNITDAGLDRLIDLLDKGSPLLIHGCFSRALPMGCLATQAAWHHPRTSNLTGEAGVAWLCNIAGLNPATSHVLRAWDGGGGVNNCALRGDLLGVFRAERERRSAPVERTERRTAAVVN